MQVRSLHGTRCASQVMTDEKEFSMYGFERGRDGVRMNTLGSSDVQHIWDVFGLFNVLITL